MARPYREAVAPYLATDKPEMHVLAQVARSHLEAEYRATFGAAGEVIAARRHELKLSQTELSASTGIPQADISKFENGKGNPTWTTLQKLVEALNLEIMIRPRTP